MVYLSSSFYVLSLQEPARAMFLHTFYCIFQIIFLLLIEEKKKKKWKKIPVTRFLVTSLPVTPLRVLLTTPNQPVSGIPADS